MLLVLTLYKLVDDDCINLLIYQSDEVVDEVVFTENDEVDEMFATENIIQWVKIYQYVYEADELDDEMLVEIELNRKYDLSQLDDDTEVAEVLMVVLYDALETIIYDELVVKVVLDDDEVELDDLDLIIHQETDEMVVYEFIDIDDEVVDDDILVDEYDAIDDENDDYAVVVLEATLLDADDEVDEVECELDIVEVELEVDEQL